MRWTGGNPGELLLNRSRRREVTLEIPLPLPAMAQLVFGYKPAAVLLAEEGCPPEVPGSALLATLFPVGYPHTWKTDRF
jgi:hypothetical protein